MFLWGNCLKMMNPGSDFGLEGLSGPGETRRDFGLPKNHCFRLHAFLQLFDYFLTNVDNFLTVFEKLLTT
jgi:hypothetical protein